MNHEAAVLCFRRAITQPDPKSWLAARVSDHHVLPIHTHLDWHDSAFHVSFSDPSGDSVSIGTRAVEYAIQCAEHLEHLARKMVGDQGFDVLMTLHGKSQLQWYR